jgi:hypothetical protein
MAGRDAAIKPALTHDPGEAYFERFAARVGERIATTAPARRGGAWDLGSLFRSPRALAWAGGMAVLVVGAGLALMTSREVVPPDLRSSRVDRSIETPTAPSSDAVPPAAPSPPSGIMAPPQAPEGAGATDASRAEREVVQSREERQAVATKLGKEQANTLAEEDHPATRPQADAKARAGAFAPEPPAAASPTAEAPRAASPSRAVEVRPNQVGEEIRVRRAGEAAPPSPSTGNVSGQTGQVHKKTMAQPLDATKRPATEGARDEAKPDMYRFAPAPPGAAAPFAEGESRLCGDVQDPSGRPVAGAQVVVSDVGRTTTTDASGRFCVRVPKGDHALSVMAVGYRESRQTVRVHAAEAAARVTLSAVPVLDGGSLARGGRAGEVRAEAEAPAEAKDGYEALPDTLRGMVRAAQRLEADAATRRSAATFDFAASAWERVLRRLSGGPLEIETRRHLAVARYRAWELGPNSRRARAAIEALTAYATRAPAGPERNEAARWLDRVRP